MADKVTALEQALQCFIEKKDFVLQGGAGSGKTETLSQLIAAVIEKDSKSRIACITHTNKAAYEIKIRVPGEHIISTIHSFLNSIIKDYKKNIHQVIDELFKVKPINRRNIELYVDEKEQKVLEHERYKRTYEKYAAKHFTVHQGNRLPKAEGKKIYDIDPVNHNRVLNQKIDELNLEISEIISKKKNCNVGYNETRFDNFRDLTFGHDGLLEIANLLFKRFPLLGKILNDKFDCIFIDEYQDTDPRIIRIFLNLPVPKKTVIGLFGDSMQAIYSNGVGSVDDYVCSGRIQKIEKLDNYRCSDEVTRFINTIRDDKLVQEVAFKNINGELELPEQRRGSFEFFYKIYENKPHSRSTEEEKKIYSESLNEAIEGASFSGEFKTLLLSNRAVALKANFSSLYDIFADRYLEPKEEIEKILTKLQLLDLFEICQAFVNRNFNLVLSKLRSTGLAITKTSDKSDISESLEKLVGSKNSAMETVELAFNTGILKKSDVFSAYKSRAEVFLKTTSADSEFIRFESDFSTGANTFTRMQKTNPSIDQDQFDEHILNLKQRNFYRDLFSDKLTFAEVLNYFRYEDEQTSCITMHKTKGTGIENVLVVLDEYFWNEYDFMTVFDPSASTERRSKNLKLVYVACSRAKVNLRCVRLISNDEKDVLAKHHKDFLMTSLE